MDVALCPTHMISKECKIKPMEDHSEIIGKKDINKIASYQLHYVILKLVT